MIAELGGRTYLMPRQPQQQPQMTAAPRGQAQDGQAPWDIPMGEDLANVENLTNNYYNAYGTLKDFTTSMWKDYGIDVTKPDFAQPGGGSLHQAFQAMDAELRMAANDLSEQKKRIEDMAKLEAQGKLVRGISPTMGAYDPNKMLARQFDVSPYVSTELNDTTLKAIDKAQQTYYTTGDVNAANAVLKPIKDEYTRLIGADPYNAEYYQRQLKAIMNASESTPSVAFRPPSTRGEKTQTIADIANKVVKDSTGLGWTPERVRFKYIGGKTVPVISPEEQTSYGKTSIVTRDPSGKEKKEEVEKIVDFYYMNPDGSVFTRYAGALANPIYDERTDNKLASELVNQFFENNPKYGSTATASEAMSPYRTSETGGVTTESFLTQQERSQGQQIKQQAKEEAAKIDKFVQAEKNKVKEQFKTTEASGYFGGIDFPIVIKGKDVKFTGKVGAKNIDLEGGAATYRSITGEDVVPSGVKLKDMNLDQFISLLERFGYFDDIVEEASTSLVPTGQQVSPQQTSQKPVGGYSGPGANFLN